MHPRRILAIFRKDLRDAIRDARVLMAILMPLGLGLLYNVIFSDAQPRPKATVAYAMADATALPDALRAVTGSTIDLTFKAVVSGDEARRLVEREEADIALVLPPGFDAAVRRGESPELGLIIPESPSAGSNLVAASLEETLRAMANQRPPATIRTDVIPAAEINATKAIFDQLGPRKWLVLTMAILLVGMIAIYAVPVILTEETEKRTLDALGLIASYLDVIVAKALVGLVYLAGGLPLMLVLTRLRPADPVTFGAGIALFSVTMIGFGLLLGGLLRTTTQVSNWSGVALLLVIFPVMLVGLPVPATVEWLSQVLPASHAARLAVNGTTGSAAFGNAWLSYLALVAWGAVAYGLLLWRLSRHEA